ncbi:TRPM5 [Mytilus coruscus]|uniref:TRPM5 n=1 Tax=Mytilus coruscus TaxID=42192 RepID=A0A6J8D0I3_MYTCO|nr:TRPM5 [Mytilus coruscus]
MHKKKQQSEKTDAKNERIGHLLHRSFLEGKPQAKELLYINITDTKRGKELLLRDLPIKWTMPEPEAVISITGIDHQFNIKDNNKLKRDLIEAVISTESWIVTCGTESGVVRFIEEAVDAHVAMKDCHIPIVGILSQRVYDQMQHVDEYKDKIAIKKHKKDNWVEIPCISTNDVLDPIHTQFIFTNNVKRNPTGSEATCREAFEHFLSNINIKETDAELETQALLPVVLVLIEGGFHALRTARIVLNHEHHVVVIDGSGGAADFLAACYCRSSRENAGEMPDKNITEVIKEHFEDESDILINEIKELSEWCMQEENNKKIHVYSLENTNGVDEIIQNAMFEINKEYHQKKIDNENGMKKKNALKTNAVKEQLKLVEKWQRCDIAKKEIVIAKNRKQLLHLQAVDKIRMDELQKKIGGVMKEVKKKYELISRNLPAYVKRFKEDTLKFQKVSKTQYFSVLSTSFDELVDHMPVEYLQNPKTGLELNEIAKKLKLIDKTHDENSMDELRNQIIVVMKQVMEKYEFISKDLSESYERFKKDVLQFKAVDKNKAKYFSDLSTSFKDIIKYMTVDAINIHKHELREIVKDIVDEYKKDMVSQLFLSSIISNRKDLVELIIDRIENIETFVFDKIANIYWRCIKESPEDLPIKLIEQKWKKQSEKTEDKKQIRKEKDESEIEIELESREEIRNTRKSNKILFDIDEFIRDLFADTKFQLYKPKHKKGNSETATVTLEEMSTKEEEIDIKYNKKPFYHLFVLSVLVNWKEMAIIFWKRDTDHTCSALFASAVLKELADRAQISSLMDLTASLNENARFFEDQACAVITELYNIDREKALKTLVTKVNRYNSTPLEIAYSQKLAKFMAHTACQAKINSIWYGDIALYTPSWRIGIAVFLPILIIQNFRFVSIPKKNPCQPRLQAQKPKSKNTITSCQWIFYCLYMFYRAPAAKFFIYMVSYLAFLVIFASFVLTDLYPLSERPPSTLEYLTWMWTLSLLLEEIRQIVQTNRGSLGHNLQYWATNVWNIFDIIMYLLFLLSVFLRCLLNSDQFYFARMAYAITLSMFILRSMHFFFVDRNEILFAELLLTFEEMENLNIVEHFALQNCQNGPSRAGSRYNARNMMTDERDMNTEADSTPTQKDIQDLRESVIEEIRHIALRQPIVVVDFPRR